MTDSPVARTTLMDQKLAAVASVSHGEVRRISIAPARTGGAHTHNGPVFGTIESGSVTFQIGAGQEIVLRAGDVFYEPAGDVVSKFDTAAEPVVFLGYFLLDDGAVPEIEFTS